MFAFIKRGCILFLYLLIVTLCRPLLIYAENTDKASEAPVEENIGQPAEPTYEYTEPEFGGNRISYPLLVLRTIAVLAAIIVGIYLILRLFLKSRNKIVTDTGLIKVLSSYPLAANRVIQVVEIAGKIMILGVSESSINLITEVEDQEFIDKIKLLSSKESKAGGSFKDQIFKLMGGKGFQKAGQISNINSYKKRISKFRKL
ncbi:MAG: flagellar biosynthetic protein FliO [Spirochaetes bacterium]|nr:flagellar biosynthetic protein FliO [Spirochaetota bacterium]